MKKNILKTITFSFLSFFSICSLSITNVQEGDLEKINKYKDNSQSFFARILIKEDLSVIQKCGGSILDDNHVLSAAHCFYKDGKRISEKDVLVSTTLSYSLDKETLKSINKLIIHPDFNPVSLSNDIAIIELKTPFSKRNWIEKNKTISSISLPNKKTVGKYNNGNVLGYVPGLGYLNDRGDKPKYLQIGKINIHNDDSCKENINKNKSNFTYPENSKMICTYNEEKEADNDYTDVCSGDSGGPLSFIDEDNSYQQIGVVSFGLRSSCDDVYDGVYYTELFGYLDFINESVGKKILPINLSFDNVNNLNLYYYKIIDGKKTRFKKNTEESSVSLISEALHFLFFY